MSRIRIFAITFLLIFVVFICSLLLGCNSNHTDFTPTESPAVITDNNNSQVANPNERTVSTKIGNVNTAFALFGDHKVSVISFTDPKAGTVCYLSRAVTGGISGALGVARDPAIFSISCVKEKSVDLSYLPKSEEIESESVSVFRKSIYITRMVDVTNNSIIYLAVARSAFLNGSPFNSVSVVKEN